MTQETIQPSITFLNMTGDVTITWDAENEYAMLAMIEQKMKENYSFFILKPRVKGLSILGTTKRPAKSMKEVAKAGAVIIDDEEFEKMMRNVKINDAVVEAALVKGTARLAKSEDDTCLDTVSRAKTPAEVVRHQTLAVRRVVGG